MARHGLAGPGASFDAEQLAELHLLEAALGGLSILEFIPRVSPVMPGGVKGLAPMHLLPIANQIALAEYQPVRACVSVPPRHGKTELIIHGIAWYLQRHPEHTVMYCSYSGDIAASKSVRARDLVVASGMQLVQDRAMYWTLLSGGGTLASGVGGMLTGMGANLIIVDDPIKNREEAESQTRRDNIYEWFTSTVMTRLTPTASIIVVHTRWHQDDLIGRLEKKGGWHIINLPAHDESGQYLWPELGWTKDTLEKRRADVGEYDWWALYMGQPRPRGGRMFEEPTYYDKPKVIGAKFFIACDPAITASTHADYSVIIVGACWLDASGMPCIDILEVDRMQVEIPRLVQRLTWYQQQYGCPVGVEAVAGFKAIPQTLRQIVKGVRILDIPAVKDKFTRALPVSAAWNGLPGRPETRRIRIPRHSVSKPWVNAFLNEIHEFTGVSDVHDDQTDALAHLYYMAHHFLNPRKVSAGADISRYLPFGG